jgi:hypothetical protein
MLREEVVVVTEIEHQANRWGSFVFRKSGTIQTVQTKTWGIVSVLQSLGEHCFTRLCVEHREGCGAGFFTTPGATEGLQLHHM